MIIYACIEGGICMATLGIFVLGLVLGGATAVFGIALLSGNSREDAFRDGYQWAIDEMHAKGNQAK